MHALSRRSLIQCMGISALGLALPRLAWADETAPASAIELTEWLKKLRQNAAQLAARQTSPLEWQEVMDTIYRQTPLEPLRQQLGFAELSKRILEQMPADRHEVFQDFDLPDTSSEAANRGAEVPRVLITKLAHVRKGHAVPPHGHSNMVSAFLCLSGEFDVQLFDRLALRDDSLVVRATVHQPRAVAGTWSSVSDYRDNVHWLTAKSDDCFLFTCKMIAVEPNIPLNGRINIDMRQPKRLGNDTYLAKKITGREAAEIY